MVVRAAGEGRARLAARLALILSEQNLGGRDPDARERLRRFAGEGGQRARAARQLADRIARSAGARDDERMDEEEAGRVLALAFPDRVAKARAGRAGAYLMANGRGAALDSADPLAREPYLVIADLAGRAERAAILLAAPLSQSEIEDLFAGRIEARESVTFDPASGAARGRRARMLGKIALSEGPLDRPAPALIEAALLDAVRADLSLLPWRESELQFRARVALMRALEGEAWPDLGDEALAARLDEFLAPALAGARRLADLEGGPLMRALEALLPYPLRARLERDAPARLATPAGGSALIDYRADGGPAVEVRLQELFGVSAHPRVGGGRMPLTIVLLSPAQRPIQTTKDLPGFWNGSYAAVRAEMRGRYPKHPWPDDPLNAAPTRRAKPRPS
jgi:ATP-dependent helicase HrpB